MLTLRAIELLDGLFKFHLTRSVECLNEGKDCEERKGCVNVSSRGTPCARKHRAASKGKVLMCSSAPSRLKLLGVREERCGAPSITSSLGMGKDLLRRRAGRSKVRVPLWPAELCSGGGGGVGPGIAYVVSRLPPLPSCLRRGGSDIRNSDAVSSPRFGRVDLATKAARAIAVSDVTLRGRWSLVISRTQPDAG